MRKYLVFLGFGLAAVAAQPAAAQVTSVQRPPAVPKAQVMPRTETAVTTLRATAFREGLIRCFSGGRVEMEYHEGHATPVRLKIPFTFSTDQTPGTCEPPSRLTADEQGPKTLVYDLTDSKIIDFRANGDNVVITTSPIEPGRWLTGMMRRGNYFAVEARRGDGDLSANYYVTRVDDQPN